MSESTYVGAYDEETVTTPVGGYNPGDIVVPPSGRPGFVASQRPLEEGEPARIRTTGKIDVAAASATLFAEGAEVEWDDTAKLAVAATAGDFDLGVAAREKIDGETVVRIILNG
jgi:hypothetical protein